MKSLRSIVKLIQYSSLSLFLSACGPTIPIPGIDRSMAEASPSVGYCGDLEEKLEDFQNLCKEDRAKKVLFPISCLLAKKREKLKYMTEEECRKALVESPF